MILGNADNFKGNGLVAFLDILGFSHELKSRWNDRENNPLHQLLELKKNLPYHTAYPLERQQFFKGKNVRIYQCRVQTISDSIVVSCGLEEGLDAGAFVLAIQMFLWHIVTIWSNSLAAGFTIRGAADFGPIYWNEKEIIGPAFITAYELEQKHAKTSRVILSSNLNQFLKKMCSQEEAFWKNIVFERLKKDIDGYLIVNPHGLYGIDCGKQDVIDRIVLLRDSAVGINKEKYAPLLACLSTDPEGITEKELGLY